jgi:hypothetical protein
MVKEKTAEIDVNNFQFEGFGKGHETALITAKTT